MWQTAYQIEAIYPKSHTLPPTTPFHQIKPEKPEKNKIPTEMLIYALGKTRARPENSSTKNAFSH